MDVNGLTLDTFANTATQRRDQIVALAFGFTVSGPRGEVYRSRDWVSGPTIPFVVSPWRNWKVITAASTGHRPDSLFLVIIAFYEVYKAVISYRSLRRNHF